MLYEFAITPQVFDCHALATDRVQQIIVVELLRGLLRNGLLANLHKGEWRKAVSQQVETLPHAIKDKVTACLSQLHDRNRIVKHRKGRNSPACENDWVGLALEADKMFGLQGIVHTDQYKAGEAASPPLIPMATALDSPRWSELREAQTPGVPTTDEAQRKMLSPMLRHAKDLVLIDRFLTPHEPRFFRTVKICMGLLRSDPRGFRHVPIHIHGGDPCNTRKDHHPESVEKRQEEWHKALRGFISEAWPYRFEISLWRDPFDPQEDQPQEGQRFHDRYFLTNQCGIGVQGGLDTRGRGDDLTTWSLLDAKERQRIADLVTVSTSPWTRIRFSTIGWSEGRLETHINSDT